MKFRFKLFLLIFVTCSGTIVSAQTTVVMGTITDSVYNQPLPFVTVSIPGTNIAVASNASGKYKISSENAFKQIKISFLGYKEAIRNVIPGKDQVVNIKLHPVSKQLNEVVIGSAKRLKYSNKDNPAVELIRKVIANKEKNMLQSYPYVEYREYDKLRFSLGNISDKISDKKIFHQYKFLLDNRDTVSFPGKSLVPIFLDEKLSQYYYRKNPLKEKTVTLGEKTVNFGADVDNEGMTSFFKYLYFKVDIYANNILLINSNFLSPVASSAPVFYKYFITDTITKDSIKLVGLSFVPRNTNDVLFEGKIYVTLDGNYAIQEAELAINKNININFLNSLNVNLKFEKNPDGRYHLSNSKTLADFGLNKRGLHLFGTRDITYKKYLVNNPLPDSAYENPELMVPEEAKHRSDDFWTKNRLDTLSSTEANTYKNVDSLLKMRSFRITMDIATIILGGYKNFGQVEIGPIGNFYGFSPVEGLRSQFGGRTTTAFSKRYYFEAYGAYGSKDEKFKYYLSTTYSLNDKSIYKFPEDYIKASVQRDIGTPGQSLQPTGGGNVLFSFKRGNNAVYLYDRSYRLDYVHEFESHFSYSLGLNRLTQSPAGALSFISYEGNTPSSISGLITTEFTAGFRYAPNEQFYQGKVYRFTVPSKYPIISLNYSKGVKNIFDGQYSYQKLVADFYKHFYLSQLGYADVSLEAGRLFGQVPFPLLDIPPANQTYFYNIYAYNLMNYLEFVSDHYESINIDQHFNGFFFNKIPLFKKLKWREVMSFKAIWGGVSDENNPALHPSLYQLPVTTTGQPLTYALGNVPYEEGSVGVENILKIIRLDLVRRFTYLEHPDVSEWGVRVSTQLNF